MQGRKSYSPDVNPDPHWLIKHAALSYANQWFVTDRVFMKKLKAEGSLCIDADILGALAAKYMVARGFKKDAKKPKSTARWVKAAALLEAAATSTQPVHEAVRALATSLGRVAPARDTESTLLSAATKFLWFAGRHEVRILDARAVNALSEFSGESGLGCDYHRYSTAWNKHFKEHQSQIKSAIALLPAHLEWTSIPLDEHGNARRAFKHHWFVERVFDKYLWTVGTSGRGSATSFV